MSNFIIDVELGSERGSIEPDVGFHYTNNLNDVNEAEIKLSGSGKTKRGLLQIGATVYIYRNGVLEFKGLIDNTDYFVGGTVVFHASGWEVWLAKENGTYNNSPWEDTASATIFGQIIGESTKFTAGTINAGFNTDFRLSESQSLWNGIGNLATKTSQDISINYTTNVISILNHLGSSSIVATLNEGIQISNLRRSVGLPRGNRVTVYGKGDGNSQIKATRQDLSLYGRIDKTVVDRSIVSNSEAGKLADAELAMNKDPPNIYDFELNNPEYTGISLGDHIELNALDMDVEQEQVRIVGIERGRVGASEFCSLQLTNPEMKHLMRTKGKVLAELQKKQTDDTTYMQGNLNVLAFSEMINANNTAPLRVFAYLPSFLIYDEIGRNTVNLFNLDYEVNTFRSGVGTATESNVAPTVTGTSSSTQPSVSGTSGSTSPWVSGTSSNTQPSVTGNTSTIGAGTNGYSFGMYSANVTGNGSWRNVGTSINLASTPYFFHGVFGTFEIDTDAGDGMCWNSWVDVRLRRGTSSDYWPSSSGMEICVRHGGAGIYTNKLAFFLFCPVDWGGNTIRLQYRMQNQDSWASGGTYVIRYGYIGNRGHLHGDGSFEADNHRHGDGSFETASHNHSVSIGSGVYDSASVNATQISEIKLYHYNLTTSSWDLKHTITNTGKTFDTDVDISNGGMYPDAAGSWKVEIKTNNASPDLVQAVIKCRHKIEF